MPECRAIPVGPTPEARRIEALADSFPCLRNAVGIQSWNANRLAAWAKGPISHGQRVTASTHRAATRCSGEAWPCGRFDLMEAHAVWDPERRTAFLDWGQGAVVP